MALAMNHQNLQKKKKKWYLIQDENTDYVKRSENGTSIKFGKKVIKSSLCNYSDA